MRQKMPGSFRNHFFSGLPLTSLHPMPRLRPIGDYEEARRHTKTPATLVSATGDCERTISAPVGERIFLVVGLGFDRPRKNIAAWCGPVG